MFTFGDAFYRALGVHADKPQQHMTKRVVQDRNKALINFASAVSKAAFGSVTNKFAPSATSHARRADQRVNIAGIGGERAIEKAARLRHILGGPTFVVTSQTLKMEVHEVWGRGLFRRVAPRPRSGVRSARSPDARRFRPAC